MTRRVSLSRLLEYAEEAGYTWTLRDGTLTLYFQPPLPEWEGAASILVEFRVEDGYAVLEGTWLEGDEGRVKVEEELFDAWLLCVDPGAEEKEYVAV